MCSRVSLSKTENREALCEYVMNMKMRICSWKCNFFLLGTGVFLTRTSRALFMWLCSCFWLDVDLLLTKQRHNSVQVQLCCGTFCGYVVKDGSQSQLLQTCWCISSVTVWLRCLLLDNWLFLLIWGTDGMQAFWDDSHAIPPQVPLVPL